jgi:TetR/AcrR family transcriptional regulator, regulator of biofilm formation and stress response
MAVATRQGPAGPRRSERGEERRAAILEATVRLLATRGLGAVTHRAVAREARVPLAATTYYFDSKDELLAEALQVLAEAEVSRLSEVMGEIGGRIASEPRKAVTVLAEALLPDGARAEQRWLAQFEIYLEAARNPALRPAIEHWRASFETLAESTLRAAGAPEPRKRAPLLVAGVNGILLDRIRGIGRDPERTMLTRFRELFELLIRS